MNFTIPPRRLIKRLRYIIRLTRRVNKKTYSAKEIPGVTLNADDVLRYNPVTGLIHWAVAKDDKTIALYGFFPDYFK